MPFQSNAREKRKKPNKWQKARTENTSKSSVYSLRALSWMKTRPTLDVKQFH